MTSTVDTFEDSGSQIVVNGTGRTETHHAKGYEGNRCSDEIRSHCTDEPFSKFLHGSKTTKDQTSTKHYPGFYGAGQLRR